MITKSKVAKIAAGFVGLALVASFAVTANAQSAADLQAQIQALLAQIAQLQGSTSGSSSSHTFTVDLTVGSTGADVTALQQVLVSKGFLTMPAGVAMGTFGPLTKSAVAAWQASAGLPATGYFGPLSRAKLNTTGGTTGSTGSTGSTSGSLQGGAGDVSVSERSSGVEDEILEGDEEVKVLGFEVEADGSDVAVTSVRVEFEHDGSGSDRLDRYVDEVFVMQGTKIVGSADADEFNESSDVYSENIALSGAVVGEDETERFYVAITAANNIDSDDLSQDWEVALGQIRFEDATGAILTDNTGTGVNGTITETFSFEDLSSSGDIELTVSEDDDEINDAHTVQVDDSSDTNDVELLSFTIEADGSDLFLNDMEFSLTSTGAGVTEMVSDLRLMMEGDEVGSVSLSGGFSSSTATNKILTVSDLDDDEVSVDEGDTVSFTLVADINNIDGGFVNGASIAASTTASDIDAEDENGDDVTDLTGSAESDGTSFSASGVTIDVVSTDTDVVFNLDSTSDDDQGKFIIVFDVTAFDESAYVELSATRGTSESNTGANYLIENANDGTASTTGSIAGTVLTSTKSPTSNNRVKINAGATERFTLTIYYNPATADSASFRGQLYSVNFAETDIDATEQELALPAAEFQTDPEFVN